MGKSAQLPDDESLALFEELKRLYNEEVAALAAKGKSDRGARKNLGVRLGYPRDTASQTVIDALARGRVGETLGEALYKALGVTREELMRAKGLAGASHAQRVLEIAAREGLSAAEALSVTKDLVGAEAVSDEEIERRIDIVKLAHSALASSNGTPVKTPARLVRPPARGPRGVNR